MTPLERLENAKGGPFTYLHRGEVRGLPSPTELSPTQLLNMLARGPVAFGLTAMPEWKALVVIEAWRVHHDLPEPRDMQRLGYLIERYSNALEFDLATLCRADLGELWRARRWRYLLNLIDHLPTHSHYSAAVLGDEEHAKMLAESMAARRDRGEEVESSGPSLTGWTPEVGVLADLVDAVNDLRHVLIAVNTTSGPAPQPPERYKRPKTALAEAVEIAEFARRKRNHDALTARLLPHKRD